jgi:hypothetical protein
MMSKPADIEEFLEHFWLVPTLLRGNACRTKIMGKSRYKFTNANSFGGFVAYAP